jgi:hypothetical protein
MVIAKDLRFQSTSNDGTMGPLTAVSAVSRKTHGTAGTFDITLPQGGTSAVEDRSGGANGQHTIVGTFSNTLASGSATVSSGTGSVSSVSMSGNTVTANLTGVTDAQVITLTFTNITDVNGNVLTSSPVNIAFLVGDTNGDRFVNTGDALQTRNRSGQAADASNFRSDVNADGMINSGDSFIVRSHSGGTVTAHSNEKG